MQVTYVQPCAIERTGWEYDQIKTTTHIRYPCRFMRSDLFHKLLPQNPEATTDRLRNGSSRAGSRGEAEPDSVADAFTGGTVCWRNRAGRRYDCCGNFRSLHKTSGDPMENRRRARDPR